MCFKHIFDQRNNAKKIILPTYLPYFFRTVTGNKQFLFLGLRYISTAIGFTCILNTKFVVEYMRKNLQVDCVALQSHITFLEMSNPVYTAIKVLDSHSDSL